MHLSLNDDQRAILDALDTLCRPYESAPIHDAPLAATSAALEEELLQGGFLDVALDPDLGCITAALIVERLARLPVAVEAAHWALVRPLLGDDLSYPLCVVDAARPHRPVRHARVGASVAVVGEGVAHGIAAEGHLRAEPEALFAYPVATMVEHPVLSATTVSPVDLLVRWRVGLAAETAGLLAAALSATTTYLSDRQQFGRPLATFQALRHRLAEAQVRINGVYWLAMKAAATLDPGDAALAALHAQETIRSVVYDLHQFLGAMGMTLEHPLHFWTYRAKLLGGELGGRGGQALAAAKAVWG